MLSSWFQLLRVPNLLTAPGDSLGGLLFACLLSDGDVSSPAVLLTVAAASICAYAFGIITNDLFDLPEDRQIRPERPLPSGAIGVRAAIMAAIVAVVLAIGFTLPLALRTSHPLLRAPLFMLLLLCVILVYNGGAKRHRLFGSIVMGLCRGCNVLFGIACCENVDFRLLLSDDLLYFLLMFIPAVAVTLIITFVTWIADGENRTQRLGMILFAPAAIVLMTWLPILLLTLGLLPLSPSRSPLFLLIPSLCALWAFISYLKPALKLFHRDVPPAVMQPTIGCFIRSLIPWQLSWICYAPFSPTTAYTTAIILFAAWFATRQLAKHIAQS